MKKVLHPVILIIVNIIVFSCASDESETEGTLTNIEGTVQGSTSCNTEKEELAYEIVPSNIELSVSSIITATLPEELKEEGLRIKFDMKPSGKYITSCTANFLPDQFYEVFNAKILND
ncbi:hypothetical protein [Salegentibacter sp. Hel_I_6]|jgi:hypothetical protein|uniref:hypothetical protein n=1 Tax=Salegentibacter sp. Hel_I_6 TaxID=1250278 RepID=UPI0005680DBB|nr:hypothetical protein [Salegentibacter sp. Hel_I_6]